MRIIILTVFFIFVLFMQSNCLAGPADLTSVILNEKKKSVLVDYCIFRGDEPGEIRLEIYFQVFNSSLQFKPTEDLFKAEYEVNISVMDKKGKKLAGESQTKTISVGSEIRTKSSSDFRTSQINLTLEPAKFDIRFALKDVIANKTFSKEFEADGKKFAVRQPLVSDILFAQAAGPADTSSAQFTKGNLMVVPSVARSY
ncbi:MAG: hypothetical protein ACREBV_07775, partial [Candidatus Zixiibacteriota bacterium]